MAIDPTHSTTDAAIRQQRNAELKKACKQFESVLTYEMLKSMRSTVDKCDLFSGGEGEEIYESLLDQELSKNMTGYGSNSLAELLYRQMSRLDSSIGTDQEAAPATEAPSSAEHVLPPGINQVAPLAAANISGPEHVDQPSQDKTHPEPQDASLPALPVTGQASQIESSAVSAEDAGPDWPVKAVLTSKFGFRKDPFTTETRFHAGIDIAAAPGSEVKAAMSGKVIISGYMKGYGNIVALDNGKGVVTIYAHNERNLVKAGDQVEKGSLIAKVGSTGRSTGAHLHFEVRKDGKKINPLEFLGAA
jgi:murein DD-endopeptidase MepM/ murein hydrolase activator NlpD